MDLSFLWQFKPVIFKRLIPLKTSARSCWIYGKSLENADLQSNVVHDNRKVKSNLL